MLSNILFVYIVWANVNTKEDFKFIFDGLPILIFVSCLYGVYEQITQSNSFIEYTAALNGIVQISV